MTDVRMPDGTIIRNVPEGTTRAQLMARLQKAQPKARGGILGTLENVVSSGNELLLGGVEGIYNAASAVTDPLVAGAMNLLSEDSGTRAREGANRTRRNAVSAAERAFIPQANPIARTAGRIGGTMAIPIPKIGQATMLARGANRALQGAIGGAGVREVDESAVAPALTGAAANVILPPMLARAARSKGGQAIGRAIGAAAAPAIRLADDAAEAVLPRIDNFMGRQFAPLNAIPEAVVDDALAPLGRQARARMARLRALGVKNPTTGVVTRDPAAFSFEQNTARLNGVGDDLAQQMRDQERELVEKGQSLVRNLGGAKGPEGAGKAVEDVLDAKRGEMQQVTSRLYERVREERGDEAVGDLSGFRQFLDDPRVTDNAAFDSMRESVSRRLARLKPAENPMPAVDNSRGVKLADQIKEHWISQKAGGHRRLPVQVLVRGNGQIDGWVASKSGGNLRNKMYEEDGDRLVQFSPDDEAGLAALVSSGARPAKGGVTVTQAEELRKFIGGLGSGIEPSVRMMRREMIDALDEDVVNVVGDDAFKAARASARARFEEFGKTFAGKLADEKVAPEALTRRILGDGVRVSDLRALKRSLFSGTDEQVARGQEAWRGLQAQAIDDLLTKAIDADGNLTGTVLSREFSKSATKFRELLGPDDFKTLRRLSAATRDVKAYPVGHSVNTSNTATTLANLFDNTRPAIKEGWAGLLGKVGLRAGAHAGAATVAGPLGNVAVEAARAAGGAAAAAKAEQAAAAAILEKIKLARNPEEAAAAIKAAQQAAASNPGLVDVFNKAGLGRLIGGAAASPQ